MNEIRASVAMATFNGEKYICEQLDSILANMSDNDELVISDDGSTDNTLQILNQYAERDHRIKILKGPGHGVKQNFANAIQKSSGKYIFLSDQDDVWEKDKIEVCLQHFNSEKCTCILHDAMIVDEQLTPWGKTFFQFRKSKIGFIPNIIKNSYIGCCMAFDSSLKEKILPIPDSIEMHDQWIGLISEMLGESSIIDGCLINYRRHQSNVSGMSRHLLPIILKNRIILIYELIRRKMRINRYRDL